MLPEEQCCHIVSRRLRFSVIEPAISIAHQHIVAVVNTLAESKRTKKIRILDFGCGNGALLEFMQRALPTLQPAKHFEFCGLDVSDAGVQEVNYFTETRRFLASRHPGVNWQLSLIKTDEKWPFPADYFDFIVSNQVMEHVADHKFVFGEIERCLVSGGASVNLFPLKEIVMEGHAVMPLVHRIKNIDTRTKAMLFLARIGFRKHYHRDKPRYKWGSMKEFAHVFSRVLETDTNYLLHRELADISRGADLRHSFTFSKEFIVVKLLSYLGYRPYRYHSFGILDHLALFFVKRITSVTLILQK